MSCISADTECAWAKIIYIYDARTRLTNYQIILPVQHHKNIVNESYKQIVYYGVVVFLPAMVFVCDLIIRIRNCLVCKSLWQLFLEHGEYHKYINIISKTLTYNRKKYCSRIWTIKFLAVRWSWEYGTTYISISYEAVQVCNGQGWICWARSCAMHVKRRKPMTYNCMRLPYNKTSAEQHR